MISLPKRLNVIIDYIPNETQTLADIGCDHGKLAVAAVLSGKCITAIGGDISKPSLEKGIKLAQKYNVADKVKFVVSDGFTEIQDQVDIAVIAGMGGNEIVKILSQKNNVKKFILCPHQDAHVVRQYMNQNGFNAEFDTVLCDNNRFYSLIVTKKGKMDYGHDEIYLGKDLPKTNDYILRNEKRLDYLTNLIQTNGNDKLKFSKKLQEEYEVLSRWQKSKKS